jgi:hypothetical protein
MGRRQQSHLDLTRRNSLQRVIVSESNRGLQVAMQDGTEILQMDVPSDSLALLQGNSDKVSISI